MRNSLWEDFKLYVIHSGNVLNKLLAINIGVFLVTGILHIFFRLFKVSFDIHGTIVHPFLAVPAHPLMLVLKPWTVVTYQFVHAGLMHIFFNMIVLLLGGRIYRDFIGDRRLLTTYLMGGLVGAVVFVLGYNLIPLYSSASLTNVTMVGASASILAVLTAAGTLVPRYTVQLFLFGRVQLVYIVAVIVVIDILSLAGANAGGHLAHLGGAAYGFLYVRMLQNGTNLSGWLESAIEWLGGVFRPRPRPMPRHVKDRVYATTGSSGRGNLKVSESSRISQQEIDAILDKILSSGYDSLSQREKDLLNKASEDI